jgi:hypothetical protein
MEHREYACQPAGTLLRGSRDSEQKIGSYLFHI